MFRRLFDSLRVRMTLLTAAALLPALVLLAQNFLEHRQTVLQRASGDAERYRDALIRTHNRVLESTRQLLAALARIPSVQEGSTAGTSELLSALKEEHPVYLNLFAARPNGELFASALPLDQPVNFSDTPWFQSAGRAQGFVVGDVREERMSGKWALTLGYSVRNEDGGLRAVVGAALPLEWFSTALRNQVLPRDAAICIFDDTGRVIAHFGQGQGENHARFQQAVHVARDPMGTLSIGEDRARWTYAYSYLVDTASGERIYMAVGMPAADAIADAEKMLVGDLLRLLMVAAFVIAGGWVASRYVIEAPVRRMLEATRRLAAGDLSARSGVTAGPRELAEFGRHFDSMAATLEQRDAELRRYQRELEASANESLRRREEAELRSQAYQRELHAVMQRVQDVIFRLDCEGRLAWATPSIETMTGYRLIDVLEKDICTCMAEPADMNRLLRLLREGGGQVRDFAVRIRRKNDDLRFAAINAQYVYDASGAQIGIEGVARDITDQARAHEQLVSFNRRLEERVRERTSALERINSELEAFTYSVSHDLRAPLRSIEGFAKLVLMRYSAEMPDDGREYLARVQRAAQRMAHLIDDLLSLSRINRYEVLIERIDLTALATEILAELRSHDPERTVEVRIAPGLEGRGDPRLLRVALQNLLENAWKYTGTRDAPLIEFDSLVDSDGRQVFRVRDNGVGFDMAYANKLFAPFQRLHSDDEFEGMGIGLATVMRVIQRHDGEIWVEAAPGRGAAFYFRMGSGREQPAHAA